MEKGKILIALIAIVVIIFVLTGSKDKKSQDDTMMMEEGHSMDDGHMHKDGEGHTDDHMKENDLDQMEEGKNAMEESSNINLAASTVRWTGSKLVGGSHTATTPLVSGVLNIGETGEITGGKFVLDMTASKATPGDEAFLGHVLGTDFFDSENYPEATFMVTSATDASIAGDLTMKGVTKNIEIPYTVSGGVYKANFDINRTDWGIDFGSGVAGAVGDAVISDMVQMEVMIATI